MGSIPYAYNTCVFGWSMICLVLVPLNWRGGMSLSGNDLTSSHWITFQKFHHQCRFFQGFQVSYVLFGIVPKQPRRHHHCCMLWFFTVGIWVQCFWPLCFRGATLSFLFSSSFSFAPSLLFIHLGFCDIFWYSMILGKNWKDRKRKMYQSPTLDLLILWICHEQHIIIEVEDHPARVFFKVEDPKLSSHENHQLLFRYCLVFDSVYLAFDTWWIKNPHSHTTRQ